MLHQEGFPETLITNPDIANHLGYSMAESAYLPMALEAKQEGATEAAAYLMDKAYQDGAAKTIGWATATYTEVGEIMDLAGAITVIDTTTNERLIKAARSYDPPSVLDKVAPLAYRRILGFAASRGGEPIPRFDVYTYLGMLEVSSYHGTMRLIESGLLHKVGKEKRGFSIAPTPKLDQLVASGGEIRLWRDIYRLGQALGFRSEAQILHYLVTLGQATLKSSNGKDSNK
jgi:hypothetical protein